VQPASKYAYVLTCIVTLFVYISIVSQHCHHRILDEDMRSNDILVAALRYVSYTIYAILPMYVHKLVPVVYFKYEVMVCTLTLKLLLT
jgi:hypothetical protein